MRKKLLAMLLSFSMASGTLASLDAQIYAAEPGQETKAATSAALAAGKSEVLTDRALTAVNLTGNNGAETYTGAQQTGVYLSWRSFDGDYTDGKMTTTFSVYRDDTLIASDLAVTNYIDTGGGAGHTYRVEGSKDSDLKLKSKNTAVWNDRYKDFKLYVPKDDTMPDGSTCSYTSNDMSVGDVDGDGILELIVKWYPSNAKDNSQAGYTGKTYLDSYKIDYDSGAVKLLSRIDLGINIRSGAHYTQFQVWDYDGDGKAEIAVKTSDGTTSYKSNDGTDKDMTEAAHVGACNADALPAATQQTAEQYDYRSSNGHIITGNEYFSIFNAEDGSKAAEDVSYLPERGDITTWGDSSKNAGNRSERYLSGTAYLDGEHPFAVFTRGYYERTAMAAYYMKDTDGNGIGDVIDTYWVFDTHTYDGGDRFTGQGNHGLSINDVDGDGKDEIVFSGLTLNDDGTPLYTTGLEHGDAMHVSDWVPWNEGLEVMDVHEHEGVDYHVEIHDAKTGRILMAYYNGKDTGRGVAADIDPTSEGGEWWGAYAPDGSSGGKVYSAWSTTGNLVQLADSAPSQNFSIFWDGDLLSELLNGDYDSDKKKQPTNVYIEKWNYEEGKAENLFSSTELWSNNGTKGNVGLAADILGDWREEIISRVNDADGTKTDTIRIYTTTIETEYTVPCLLENRAYREGVAWQNVGYNQPANLSYLLSEGLVTAQLSLKEAQTQKAVLLFTPASDGTYGHAVTGYEIYRDNNDGNYTLIDSVSLDALAKEQAQPAEDTEEKEPKEERIYTENFEGEEHSFKLVNLDLAQYERWEADTATKNQNTSGHIYGVGAGSGDTGSQVDLSAYDFSGKTAVSLDLRMDGCTGGKSSSFALLATPCSSTYLKSHAKLLTITASASGSGNWGTIKINGNDITSKANIHVSGDNNESGGQGLKRDTTGWLHLDASLDFKTKTTDVTLTRKSDNSVIYQGTLGFIDESTAIHALRSIYIAGGKGYGGVYLDDIMVKGTSADIETVSPQPEFYYVYEDTSGVKENQVYNYKIAAVVDGRTSFLSRPLQVRTAINIASVPEKITQQIVIDTPLQDGQTAADLLDQTVPVVDAKGETKQAQVTWDVSAVDITKLGNYPAKAYIQGWPEPVEAVISVINDYVTDLENIYLEVELNQKLEFPETAQAVFASGKRAEVPISWLEKNINTSKTGSMTAGYTTDSYEGMKQASIEVVYPAVWRFDFGLDAEKAEKGWTEIRLNYDGSYTNERLGVNYTAERRYGFEDGTIKTKGRNEGVSQEGILPYNVYSDTALLSNQTFLADVENGTYLVSVIASSGQSSTNKVEGTIENESMKMSCKNGYYVGTYKVPVTDGQINIAFNDRTGRVAGIIIRKVETESTEEIPVEKVVLDKSELSFETLDEQKLYASVSPVNADNKTLTWTSSDTSVAAVKDGVVTPLKNGTAVITVSSANNQKAECQVTVKLAEPIKVQKIQITPQTVELNKAGQIQVLSYTAAPENAANKDVIWSSSDDEVASVKNGIVTAKKTGTATITAEAADKGGAAGTCQVTVNIPVPVTGITVTSSDDHLFTGDTMQFTANVQPDNATNQQVEWCISDNEKAELSADGKSAVLTAKKAGEVTVTAVSKENDEIMGTKVITITNAPVHVSSLVVSPDEAELKIGDTLELECKVLPESADNKNLHFDSKNREVATVDETGKVTAAAAGVTEITVVSAENPEITAKCVLTVKEAGTGGDTEDPGDDTENPGGNTENPGDNTQNPGDTGNPGDNTGSGNTGSGNQPGGDNTGSGNQPGGDNTGSGNQPGDNTGSGNTGNGSQPGGTDNKNPGGQDKTETPAGKPVTPTGGDKARYKVLEQGKAVVYEGPADKKQKEVIIPDIIEGTDGVRYAVTEISANAFRKNTAVTAVTIGDNIKKIPAKAFEGCTNLKKVIVGKNVVSIGASAFAGDKKLQTLTLKTKRLKTIGASAFKNCAKLKKMTLPNSVTSIGASAFRGAKAMTSITIGTSSKSALKTIGNQAFYGCAKLKTITIHSKKLSTVGKNALKGIKKTAKIIVPKSKYSQYKKKFAKKGQHKNVTIKKGR